MRFLSLLLLFSAPALALQAAPVVDGPVAPAGGVLPANGHLMIDDVNVGVIAATEDGSIEVSPEADFFTVRSFDLPAVFAAGDVELTFTDGGLPANGLTEMTVTISAEDDNEAPTITTAPTFTFMDVGATGRCPTGRQALVEGTAATDDLEVAGFVIVAVDDGGSETTLSTRLGEDTDATVCLPAGTSFLSVRAFDLAQNLSEPALSGDVPGALGCQSSTALSPLGFLALLLFTGARGVSRRRARAA